MIRALWNSYIEWMLSYLDTNNGFNHWKFAFIEILHIVVVFSCCVLIFYFFSRAENILGIFVISIGYGRIIFDQILKKYDQNHPYDSRYTPFLRSIAYSAILFVTIGYTFVLIEDANEHNTSIQKIVPKNMTQSYEIQKIIREKQGFKNE